MVQTPTSTRFPLFVTSRGISVFGDMAAVSALSVHVYDETSSGLALSGLFLARVAPRLLGAVAGAMSDRMELRRLLIACDVVAGALFAAIAVLQPPYAALLAMVFVAELAATVELPASRTMIARVLPDERRGSGNGAVTAATAIGVALGAPFGGLALGLWGYQYALLANCATFLLSVLLLFLIRRVPPKSHNPTHMAPGARPRTASDASRPIGRCCW